MSRPLKLDERGSVTLWLMITAVALFGAVGLIADGGAAMAAKGRAISDAYGAARAGAEALNRAAFAQGAPPSPDVGAARGAVSAFLSKAGADPAHAQIAVSAREVTVTVELSSPTPLLSAIGIGSITVSGHGRARPVYGVGGVRP